MTREEAVNELNDRIKSAEYVDSDYIDCVSVDAVKMVISALSVPETNVGDTISRQAAIDAIVKRTHLDWKYLKTIYPFLDVFEQLLSAEPKHGHWIESHEHIYMGNGVKEWTNWYCSECDAPNDKPTDFCPSCGARMEVDDAD